MPSMTTAATVASVSDLIAATADLQSKTASMLWFGGQRSAEWDVKPGVFRDGHAPQERNYVHRFRSRAGTRYGDSPKYGDFALWLGLMQHYGLPTRLLDWTRSPLIAAYFAIEPYLYDPNLGLDSAAIWVLQPHDLNVRECGQAVTPAIEANMVAPLLNPAFLHTEPETQSVLAVMASEHDLRMFVQQGCFTVHSDQTALNLRSGSSQYLTRLVVPLQAIRSFAREVEMCGFRKGDIYPDLDHLALELRIQKGA